MMALSPPMGPVPQELRVHYVWSMPNVAGLRDGALVKWGPCGAIAPTGFKPEHLTEDIDRTTCQRCIKNYREGRR